MRAGLRGWAHSYRQQFFSWALTGLELVWREMERGWGGGHTRNCCSTRIQECLHFGSDKKGWTEELFKEVTRSLGCLRPLAWVTRWTELLLRKEGRDMVRGRERVWQEGEQIQSCFRVSLSA